MEALTKLKPCRVCKKMKPESAFAWKLDENGVRKRSQRCAKCWAAAEAEAEAKKETRVICCDMNVPKTAARTVWRDEWPAPPEIMDNKYWTATDTRRADAEWAYRFLTGGMK